MLFQPIVNKFLLDGGSPVMLAFPRVLMGGRFRKDVLLSWGWELGNSEWRRALKEALLSGAGAGWRKLLGFSDWRRVFSGGRLLKLKDEEASVGDPAVVGDIGAGSSATSKVGLWKHNR